MTNLIASSRVSNRTPRLDLLSALPDDLLLARVRELASRERVTTAHLVAHLAEVELRGLHLSQGCSSMFTYCTEVLRLSESSAYARIEVARAVRRLPRLLDGLADGSLSLTSIRRLAPLLTPDNCDRLALEARNKTAREVDRLIAREQPKPDVPSSIRLLPSQPEHVSKRVPESESNGTANGLTTGATIDVPNEVPNEFTGDVTGDARATTERRCREESELGPPSSSAPVVGLRLLSAAQRDRGSLCPLAPERYRVQFTASAEMRARIERLKDLLRHRIADGDLAAVIDTALITLLAKLEQQRCGAVTGRRSPRARAAGGLSLIHI